MTAYYCLVFSIILLHWATKFNSFDGHYLRNRDLTQTALKPGYIFSSTDRFHSNLDMLYRGTFTTKPVNFVDIGWMILSELNKMSLKYSTVQHLLADFITKSGILQADIFKEACTFHKDRFINSLIASQFNKRRWIRTLHVKLQHAVSYFFFFEPAGGCGNTPRTPPGYAYGYRFIVHSTLIQTDAN